jgi:hypothetical protein
MGAAMVGAVPIAGDTVYATEQLAGVGAEFVLKVTVVALAVVENPDASCTALTMPFTSG